MEQKKIQFATAMLFVHSTGSHLDARGSSLKFSPTFRLLVHAFTFECCYLPLSLLHEGMRFVTHSTIGPSVPRCEPCLRDETFYENEDSGDGASRRRAHSGGQAVVTSDESGSVDREVDHFW